MKKAGSVMLAAFCAFVCVSIGILVGRHTYMGQIRIVGSQYPVESISSTSPQADTTVAICDGKIDINTATSSQLQMLPNIGETIAQRIVDFRTANGAFESFEDLLQVEGIGEKRLEDIREYITLGGSK